MKALPTVYGGHLFRSKLEAKWAAFFDLLGVVYHYEPEAFAAAGGQYTPDFYLPDVYLRWPESKGVYLEIKPLGWEYDREYVERISRAMSGQNFALFPGDPLEFIDWGIGNDLGWQLQPFWDNQMLLVYCSCCGALKIDFAESNYMECPVCSSQRDVNTLCEAATAARQKRFKHITNN